METDPKQKAKNELVTFIIYFAIGFAVGLLISLIGGFFHNIPDIMWKETIILSSILGLLAGFGGDNFLDKLGKFLSSF